MSGFPCTPYLCYSRRYLVAVSVSVRKESLASFSGVDNAVTDLCVIGTGFGADSMTLLVDSPCHVMVYGTKSGAWIKTL